MMQRFTRLSKLRQILKTFREIRTNLMSGVKKKWLLTFNSIKCKTMHISYGNQRTNYKLGGITLDKTSIEKDLEIFISSNLKGFTLVAKITAKANNCPGIIKRNFMVLNKEILLQLYLFLVRPILDSGVQWWSPHQVRHSSP